MQCTAPGVTGARGVHVQLHVAQALWLSQELQMDHFMGEHLVQDHQPLHLHAIQILVQVTNILISNLKYETSHWFAVHCTWNNWEPWGSCSATCGSGTMTQSRTTNGPLYGGTPCTGSSTSSSLCNTSPCPGAKKIFVPNLKSKILYVEYIWDMSLICSGLHLE